MSGVYTFPFSELDDAWQEMFTDSSRTITSPMPEGRDLRGEIFRKVYNDWYGGSNEFFIPTSKNKETQGVLRELIQTMEVVGDDDLELTYDEWIYLNTGSYPRMSKCRCLGMRVTRGKFIFPVHNLQAADRDTGVTVFGKWANRHEYSWNKNLLCIEPTVVAFIGGAWREPSSQDIYKKFDSDTNALDLTRFVTGADATDELDRGMPFEFEQFREAGAWLMDVYPGAGGSDAYRIQGDLGDRSSLNYWMNGEVRFDYDWDPGWLGVEQATAEEDDNLVGQLETGEGDEAFISDDKFFCGVSVLNGFPAGTGTA